MEAKENNERRDRRKGVGFALALHVVLIALLFLPLLSYQDPPPEKPGILVAFGEVDAGANSQKASSADAKPSEPVRSEKQQIKPGPKPKEAPTQKEVLRDPKSEPVIPVEVKKPEKTAEQIAAEEEARRQEEEARKKAEEEARKQKEFENRKSQFKDLLSGAGQGSNKDAGNQGDPDGKPDAKVLVGLSKGSSRVGGGLADRAVLFEPNVEDDSQKTGKVVIMVCVNKEGKVISAKYTLRGSTTSDGALKEKAIKGARQYRFSPGEIEEQCGTITFDFRVE
jgi:TonB family protein